MYTMFYFVSSLKMVVSLILLLCSLSHGYVQHLTLKGTTDEGDVLINFESNIADTSSYLIENITNVCYHGCWAAFREKDFVGEAKYFCGGQSTCDDNSEFSYLSVRHMGASETELPALSLFTGTYFSGSEIYVEGSSYSGNVEPIKSFGYSGQAYWMLWDGPSFDGNSYCLIPFPMMGSNGYFSLPNGFSTIGSAIQGGC